MKQYLDLLKTILDKGVVKESGRAAMPDTTGVFGHQMKFNLSDGFPLLTTKKMPFKMIAHELIWFLRGDTNIKYLVDNNCHIWDGDAFRHYNNNGFQESMPRTMEQFIDDVKQGVTVETEDNFYTFGDLGNTYGFQWRRWKNVVKIKAGDKASLGYATQDGYGNLPIDQIKNVIDGIKKNPFGRRHICSAWNPAEIETMALPPCHLLFHFNCRPLSQEERIKWWEDNVNSSQVREKRNFDDDHLELEQYNIPKFYLDCLMYQRSADSFLGVPFNIASYALLTEVVAKMCNMVAGEFTHALGDTHIYSNHMDAVREQLKREPMQLCKLKISDRVLEFKDIAELNIDDLSIENYVSHPAIKGELSVGI